MNCLSYCCWHFSFPFFEPSDSTRTDVRSENRQLQARLKNVISLEKMKQALEKKDLDLAAAQKEAREKTSLADKKLASVGTLEGEVNKLKSCLNEANREVTSPKKDKVVLNEKLESAIRKRNDTEDYLRTLAKKLYLTLEGISFNPTVLMLAIGFCSVD